MSDTTSPISTLIKGISDSKVLIVNKAIEMGLVPEENRQTAKLGAVAALLNTIPVHECEDLIVQVGDTDVEIADGYHKGCKIQVGTNDQIKHKYTLKGYTVNSPEPDASTPTIVSLSTQGDASSGDYYGISSVTINPLGKQYIKVEEKVDDKGTITSSDKVLYGNVAYGRNSSTGNAQAFTGSMPNKTGYWDVIDTNTSNYRVLIPEGYHNGQTNISALVTDKTIDCPTDQINPTDVTDSSGAFLSKVTIRPLPRSYANTSDASENRADNVIANKVLKNTTVYAKRKSGDQWYSEKISGEMLDQTGFSYSIDTRDQNYQKKIPEGYHDGTKSINVLAEPLTIDCPTNKDSSTTYGKAATNSYKFFDQVTIRPLPRTYANTSDASENKADFVIADKVLEGTTVYAKQKVMVDGNSVDESVKISGTIKDNTGFWGAIYTDTKDHRIKIPEGYYGEGSTITAVAVPLAVTFSDTYTGQALSYSNQDNKFYTSVSIPALPTRFGDASGCSISNGNIPVSKRVVSGTTVMAINSSGQAVEVNGEMTDQGQWDYEVDGITYTSAKIPAGYHNGNGSITFDSSVIIGLLQEI